MPLVHVFQRLSTVAFMHSKIVSASSHVLSGWKCATYVPAQPLISSLIPCRRSTRFQCLWPPDLPPATEWGYTDNGPDTWQSKYPAAGGFHQSPVDIVSSTVLPRGFDASLQWKYSPGICETLLNTGCGWRMDVRPNMSEVTGGPLLHTYELVQFHSHWGNCSTCGSEHTVDGKSYAGELHFVHWNKDLFGACSEAVPATRGLAVIGVFLEEGEPNPEIQKLCDSLSEIPEKDDRKEASFDLDPAAMFPTDHSYWTYTGSLTTPPCYESVTWVVFKNPITISQEQLNCFRQMKKPEGSGLVENNYRPPQSLNDREISECN